MKTYKDINGVLWSYESDGSQDYLISQKVSEGAKLLSASELDAIINPPQKKIEALTATIQNHLDSTSRALGYDNIYTACTYAEEPAVPKFQEEGKALRAWRSLVWEKANVVLGEVLAGGRNIPSQEELVSLLPEFIAPV